VSDRPGDTGDVPGDPSPEDAWLKPRRLHSPALDEALGGVDWDQVDMISLDELASRRERSEPRSRRFRGFLGRLSGPGRTWMVRARVRRQRAVRGWADPDWWNLRHHLCQHLGTLLLAMAEHGRTHPAHVEHDVWYAELRECGDALVAFDVTDPVKARAAQDAMRWAADNLPHLWD